MKKFLFSLIAFATIHTVQSQIVLYGVVKDSASHIAVPLATVTNLNKGRTAIADYNGRFNILAEPGNMLVTSFTGYRLDTLRIKEDGLKDTLVINMRLLGEVLPEAVVTAKSRYNQYQLDSMKRRMEYADVLDKSNTPLIGGPVEGSGFGISLNLGRKSKKETDTRHFKSQFELMEEAAYVSYMFSPAKVSEITGLKDDKLVEFMNMYRPNYDWMRKHTTDEDLLDYVNNKMKDYRKKGKLS
jgi:hypothetical protein